MMLDKTDASLSSALETGPSSADSNFNRPEPANLSQLGLERRVEIIPISQLTPYKGNARTIRESRSGELSGNVRSAPTGVAVFVVEGGVDCRSHRPVWSIPDSRDNNVHLGRPEFSARCRKCQ